MGKCEDVIPYVWFLKSDSVSADDDVSTVQLMGGALCIHPSGVLISVTHAVKPDSPFFNDASVTFSARRYKDTPGLRVVDMIETVEGKEYGLSLFKIRKLNENENEVFEAFPLPDTIAFKMGVEVFAFVYHAGPFTGAFGYTCQSYESNPSFRVPIPGGARTVGSVVTETHMRRIADSMSYDPRICNVVEKQGFYESLRNLDPDLALIQTQELLHTTLDGQCGWPVFTRKTNKLVGLIAFSTGFFQFLIPAQILREVLDRNLAILGLDDTSAPQSEVNCSDHNGVV